MTDQAQLDQAVQAINQAAQELKENRSKANVDALDQAVTQLNQAVGQTGGEAVDSEPDDDQPQAEQQPA